MKILLIEDDLETGQFLVNALKGEAYSVDWTMDGNQGFEMANTNTADLLLLDIGLPGMDGITLCHRLRSQGYDKPILLLTAKTKQTDQIQGLDAGADDYVVKPYDLQILMARIRASLRRDALCHRQIQQSLRSPSLTTWESLQINPERHEVMANGQPIHLTLKEYALLNLFLNNPKRTYSRSAILDRLWDITEYPSEGTVSTHIKSLRQKLKAAGSRDPIETVHGLGYRLQVRASSVFFPDKQHPEISSVVELWGESKVKYREMATPLTAIRGALGLLATGIYDTKPERRAEMIAIAASQSDRLTKLVDDILSLGDLEPDPED